MIWIAALAVWLAGPLPPVDLSVEVVCAPTGVVELSDPVTIRWPFVQFSDRDAEKVGGERFRIVEDPAPFSLVEPAAIACDTCIIGRYWGPEGKRKFCYAVDEGPICLRCGKPCPSEPNPIAAHTVTP